MPYALNTSKLFLTYPQCPIPKESVLELIKPLLRTGGILLDVVDYIVAHELHANGDDHLHIYFKLSDAFRTRDPTLLDLYWDGKLYHGNYQGCRSAKNVIKYCTKSEDYLSNIDVSAIADPKSTRRSIGLSILAKRPLNELVQEHPQLIFGYSRLQADINLYQESTQEVQDIPSFIPNTWGILLPYNKSQKLRHYWIWSRDPNKGKTTFAKKLRDEQGATIQSGDYTYWNVSSRTRILILDDYNYAGLRFNQLNLLGDNTFGFRCFQRGVVVLDEYLVIVLSNMSIKELYPFKYELICARFTEIELN